MNNLTLLLSIIVSLLTVTIIYNNNYSQTQIIKNKNNLLIKNYPVQISDDYAKQWALGKYEPEDYPEIFDQIPSEYCVDDPNKVFYFEKNAINAVKQLIDAAEKDGFKLRAFSTLRNFNYQNGIWTRKYDSLREKYNNDAKQIAQDILIYSAMPTTSRHHWGTDIDFQNCDDDYWLSGIGLQEYNWLDQNAAKFGFSQTYNSRDERDKGYAEERWHWSYMPVSKMLMDVFNNEVQYSDIKGFYGDETAEELQVIDNYVNAISQKSLDFDISNFELSGDL